jgi:hypothetical protein
LWQLHCLDAAAAQPQLLPRMTQSIALANHEGPVEIDRIESDVAALQVARKPAVGASQRFQLEMTLTPEQLEKGPIAGRIRIVTTNPAIPPLTIPVRGEVR